MGNKLNNNFSMVYALTVLWINVIEYDDAILVYSPLFTHINFINVII